ncbi:MAG: thioredoxin domain-containing protein [Gammaproteobacteria bacterium]|nr:thioredoxin domain-containing protein [Gammaproteobacteria bacterium]
MRLAQVAMAVLLFLATHATAGEAPAAGSARASAGARTSAVLDPQSAIHWRTRWNPELFAQAAREHRFVLLDLHAVWCHWCHVMDEQTYADRELIALIGTHYLAVSIDADSDPALATRYGDWGWPATIVLAADGTEIVKRRGFMPPAQMASLLQAIVDDPTPGPSVRAAAPAAGGVAGPIGALSQAQRAALRRIYDEAYDPKHGGWGSGQKFIDAAAMEYTLALIVEERDPRAARRARQTLDANLALIDPVWGGVYQYSATPDWTSPHYEKLLSFQADDLRIYSEAYARWHDARYLRAALALEHYIIAFLTSPEGAFYVSQDADLSQHTSGHEYYPLDDTRRRRLGVPKIDTHEYARENGWAIRALARLYEVTGEPRALAAAESAAHWVLAHRALPGGGFRHDTGDTGGPYLEDTLSLGQAFLGLYRSSGDRRWLDDARAALSYITAHFRDARGGFITAPALPGAVGVLAEPARSLEQNATLARFANLLQRYTADERCHQAALHAMRFLVASAGDADELRADVLLADRELANAPIHITVVGGKHDPAAQALHAAALAFPASYLQVDWWDRAEGPLPNPEINYPQLQRAAAFACTQRTCSMPVYQPDDISRTVTAALYSP